jgi:nucleoside-diphosphate-sugar epimerase
MTTKITVTGAGGYIGAVLVGRLLDAGYTVTALDRFFFGIDTLRAYRGHPKLQILKADIRDVSSADLEGSWGVLDLAALSNDPSGELDHHLTWEINENGRIQLAKAARSAGVKRYIFSSSCSVYGAGTGLKLTENSPLRPLSAYARACAKAEDSIRSMNGPDFTTAALRNATVFGLSPRMRFDLVVNLMTLNAFESRQILITGGGQQWRPLVHVRDVASAFLAALGAQASQIGGEAFNIGLDNFKVRKIAALVRESVPNSIRIKLAPGDRDERDYSVSFDYARTALGFEASVTVPDGIREMYQALTENQVKYSTQTKTVAWYCYLMQAKKTLSEVELNHRVL